MIIITMIGVDIFFTLLHLILRQVDMVAVNDATLLLLSIFRVIKLVFKDHPSYMQLQDLFQEVLKLEPLPPYILHHNGHSPICLCKSQ